VLVGTTDTPMREASLEPRATPHEVEFVLRNAGRYMARDPAREDVLCVFAGLRPLVRAGSGIDSKVISREHAVFVSNSGLVSILGGKWTTYRKMAEDALTDAIEVGGLVPRPCVTERLRLHGWMDRDDPALPEDPALSVYGADAAAVEELVREDAALGERLHPMLPYRKAHVVWAVRHEMARSVEDILARRTRSLLLDARASIEIAPAVAALAARELGRDAAWAQREAEAYRDLARGYTLGVGGASV
jgi:glycerol-3-phosphate dehydrogenase